MDEELKTYLQSMEERLESRTAAMIQGSEDRMATLIAAEIGNLHTQMQQGFERVDARFEQIDARFEQVDARFDSIDARLKLQAGLIQSGARAMTRFSQYAENSEERWVELDARVRALERKLKDGKQGNP